MILNYLPLEFFVFCAGILGTAAGSFFHVCIWRIPRGVSVITPSSSCPVCGSEIPWYDNVPLLSYLVLRGACRFCKTPIPFRYFLYEGLTALLFMGVVYVYGLTYTTLVYLILVSDLIVVSGIDWDHYFIPDFLSIPMIYFSVLTAALAQSTTQLPQALAGNVPETLLGIVIGGGVIWCIRILGKWIFRQEAMGFGDVKLMAFLGGFLGWDEALLCIFLASLFGSGYGLTLKWTGKLEKYGHIYFGPFLSMGAYACLMVGPKIIQWYTAPFFS